MQIGNLFLERCLGGQLFGEMYLAKINGTNKYFAIKTYKKNGIGKEYLSKEIELLQKFNHPNIIKIIDMKQTIRDFYVVMEYCNGGNLKSILNNYILKYGKGFPEEIIQHLMRQIISAMKYIHNQDVIHRDIRLENILVNFDNEQDLINLNLMRAQIKIINFTLAIKINNIQEYGNLLTRDSILLYKLRDIGIKLKDLANNKNTDVLPIGSICYTMLIGKPALDSKDIKEIVSKVESGIRAPTNISKEIISFINIFQNDYKKKLDINQIAQHEFITRKVQDFHPIILNLRQLSNKLDNIKSIWSIFVEEDEKKYLNIGNIGSLENFSSPINESSFILPQTIKDSQEKQIYQFNSMPLIPHQPSGQAKIIETSYHFSANIYNNKK